jgi:hypothetical protein
MSDILRELNLGEEGRVWREHWRESQDSFPGTVPFLSRSFVQDRCAALNMSDEIVTAFLDALPMFERRPALKQLAWHAHRLIVERDDVARKDVRRWPMVPRSVDRQADMFFPFVCLSAVPAARECYRAKGIGDDVWLDTFSDFELWIREHYRRHGLWGLHTCGWMWLHLKGRLFKLGRLQFEMKNFAFPFHAWRHATDGRVVVLAGDGARFRGDGQFADADGALDEAGAWTASLAKSDRAVRGLPVSPVGAAMPDPVELPLDQWNPILNPGDPILGVHITATGSMDHGACGESFRRAGPFFKEHFPDHEYRAFTCESWLLDNQFGGRLRDDSNIVRFMREWRLYPLPGANDAQLFERVFDRTYKDLDQAPRDNSLRRAVVDHMKSGGHWRITGGMVFPDDLDWGARVCRVGDR